ncbi:hypothetical protein AB838_12710 [Rhodobacteraceae bacterium (ex Bugula neritina AB1)]|nr:hypothetical protein AB838_12710 [Rhodobacteraceae bacterium (ex Bugula neritina AB1)]
MRIGYVLNRFPRFSQTFVLNEILELERCGHRIDIFSLARPPDEPRQPELAQLQASVTYLPGLDQLAGLRLGVGFKDRPASLVTEGYDQPCGDPLFAGLSEADAVRLEVAAAVVASHVRRLGIGHLHAHFGTNQTKVALLAARMAGIRFSWTAHARDLYLTFADAATDREMRRRKIAEAAFVVAVSEYNRQILAAICPERTASIHRIYNGIDLAACRPGKPQAGRILAAGRLVEKKGFIHLVEACGRLRDRGLAFRCEIIGDGPERDRLQQRIEDLALQDIVVLAGYASQTDLFAAMRQAAVFVLPCIQAADGDRDGLPTVLLEAMAHGLPVISSPVTGVPEIISHQQTGLLTPCGDPNALAEAIYRCVHSAGFAEKFGLRGREKTIRQFDLHANVSALALCFGRYCKALSTPLEN